MWQAGRPAGWQTQANNSQPSLATPHSPPLPNAGRAWTGRQALKLGLVDGIGDLRTVMREQYGPKVSGVVQCRWVGG